MGSHAPPPTQPLTYHVNDVGLLGYGTFWPGSVLARKNMDVSAKSMDVSFRLTKYRRFGQNVFNMFTESDIIGRGVTE